jgi:hypothetical protein
MIGVGLAVKGLGFLSLGLGCWLYGTCCCETEARESRLTQMPRARHQRRVISGPGVPRRLAHQRSASLCSDITHVCVFTNVCVCVRARTHPCQLSTRAPFPALCTTGISLSLSLSLALSL